MTLTVPKRITEQDTEVVLKFGGGVHSRPSEEDIDPRECADGQNFELDLQNFHYRPRRPFKLVGTVPNNAEIRGFVSLKKPSDNSVSMLVQAGAVVYEWDGTSFTSVGAAEATSKLRGRISHNWWLDEKVIITDINLADVVMEWDGSTLTDTTFTDEDSNPFGTFKAKYCVIQGERALFGNVDDGSTATPHMMVASKVSEFENITVANKPSSALGEDDPFYILTPDLRDINGLVAAFNVIAMSSREGQFYKVVGASAKDITPVPFYPDSFASGEESVSFVGNDIFYGRPGRIESINSTDKFGDVENDDLTVGISNEVDGYEDWQIEYDQRGQKVYCYSADTSEIWVYYKPLKDSKLSPWSRMTTLHAMSMDPTAMMRCYDPVDGLERVFFGDDFGNVYCMDADDYSLGDGNTTIVRVTRQSAIIQLPADTESFDMYGWIKYRKPLSDLTLKLKFDFQGHHIYTHTLEQTLYAPTNRNYFRGGDYFRDGNYFGSTIGKIGQEVISVPGKSTEFQITAEIEGKENFSISQIGLRFSIAK